MPGGDLTKYSVAALRKAVQKHNKQVKTGKTGVYLYKLHSTKKAAIVRFLKKNFKVTRHRASGGTQVKNKHTTHLFVPHVRKPRAPRAPRAAAQPADRDDEKQAEVPAKKTKRKKKPQTPKAKRPEPVPSTPDTDLAEYPSPSMTPASARKVKRAVSRTSEMRAEKPARRALPKAHSEEEKTILKHSKTLSLGDMLFAIFRKNFFDELHNFHKLWRRLASLYDPSKLKGKSAIDQFRANAIFQQIARLVPRVVPAYKKKDIGTLKSLLMTSFPTGRRDRWRRVRNFLQIK